MSHERRGLTPRAKVIIGVAAIVTTGLASTSIVALLTRQVQSQRRAKTLATLSQLGDNVALVDLDTAANRSMTLVALDAWQRNLRVLPPSRANRSLKSPEWLYYSVGPDGVDDGGAGDDIVQGSDAAD